MNQRAHQFILGWPEVHPLAKCIFMQLCLVNKHIFDFRIIKDFPKFLIYNPIAELRIGFPKGLDLEDPSQEISYLLRLPYHFSGCLMNFPTILDVDGLTVLLSTILMVIIASASSPSSFLYPIAKIRKTRSNHLKTHQNFSIEYRITYRNNRTIFCFAY